VVDVSGSLLLSGPTRPAVGFQGNALTFADDLTGMLGRAVWTDDRGDQLFSELKGSRAGESLRIEGRFVGGTGRFQGATGLLQWTGETAIPTPTTEPITPYTELFEGTIAQNIARFEDDPPAGATALHGAKINPRFSGHPCRDRRNQHSASTRRLPVPFAVGRNFSFDRSFALLNCRSGVGLGSLLSFIDSLRGGLFSRRCLQELRDVFVSLSDNGDGLAQRRTLALGYQNFAQHAARQSLHFHRGLVRVDFGERLAHRNLVAFFFKPARKLPLFHRG